MDSKKSPQYKNLVEGYGSGLAIRSALKYNTPITSLPNNKCWCTDPGTPLDENNRPCVPVQSSYSFPGCNSCDLNRTGECPQSSGYNTVPGVN